MIFPFKLSNPSSLPVSIGVSQPLTGYAGYEAEVEALAPDAWYRSGVVGTDYEVDVGIDVWIDRSGNGRNLIQNTDELQPSVATDNLGRGCPGFSGGAHRLVCSAASFGATLALPNVVAVAFKRDSLAADGYLFEGENASYRHAVYNDVSNDAFFLYAGAAGQGATFTDTSGWHAIVAVFRASLSLIYLDTSLAQGSAGNMTHSLRGITIGSYLNGSSGMNGKIGEVILKNNPADLDAAVASLGNYLVERHNIAI